MFDLAPSVSPYIPQKNIFRQKFSGEYPWRHLARENMEEWGASVPVVLDTIRVAVKAFAEGKVEFDEVPGDTRKTYIRSAPSFLPGNERALGGRARSYTASTLGEFLGWLVKDGNASMRLLNGLNALELIEQDCMSADNFDGLAILIGIGALVISLFALFF